MTRYFRMVLAATLALAFLPAAAHGSPDRVRLPQQASAEASSTLNQGTLGPEIVLFDSNRPTGDEVRNYEIYRMTVDGEDVVQLTDDDQYDTWWPKISPDRTKIMFQRTPAGVHDRDYKQSTTWVMNADGTGLIPILPYGIYEWEIQGHPEWSPDGTRITTMCGPSTNVQICITDADGTDPFMVTNREAAVAGGMIDTFQDEGRRGGTNVDPSFSPDGSHLLFIGCPVFTCADSLYEVYRIDVDGTNEVRLTNNAFRDHDAYYSPDGGTIAYLRQTGHPLKWGIIAMDPDGSNERVVIDDGGINSKPGWSIGSDWIFFHRWPVGRTLFNVFKIRPDGSELTELEPRPAIGFGQYDNEFPVNSSF